MIISVFLPKDFKDANKTLITSMYKTTRVHKVISRGVQRTNLVPIYFTKLATSLYYVDGNKLD